MKIFSIIILLLSFGLNANLNDIKFTSNQDSLAIKTAKEFYILYINAAYPKSTCYYQVPTFKKLDENTHIFNLEEFIERLNTIDYFSEDYKNKLVDRLES